MIDGMEAVEGATALRIDWAGGGASTLSAAALRDAARDAHSIRQRIDFGRISIAPDLTITALAAVGRAGVNIQFSDGCARAIYPFAYLAELCAAAPAPMTTN